MTIKVDPIKLIYKYKNNNKRKQYNLYIFIGSQIDENIMDILKQITYLTFIETLEKISDKNKSDLEITFGEFWYKKLFVIAHLDNEISKILKIDNLKNKMLKKFGKEWFLKHLNQYNLNKINISVSYA